MARPLVIAHRGASGYRPEHTLEGYRLAIALGADYVEPDLVSTGDGVLVARHENEISTTTDVARHPEFADRYTTKVVDGIAVSGWFTEDFTLAELKCVRATARMPWLRPGNTAHNGRYEVPTLDEVITLVQRESRRLGRDIGIYPETKHPTYFDSIGLSLEEPLVRTLARHGLDRPGAPVLVQSFETANLRDLDTMVDVPLAQLVDHNAADGTPRTPWDFVVAGDGRTYADLVTPAGLAWIATYADGVGLNKDWVLPRTGGATTTPSSVVADAHDQGLLVHVWTLRLENRFMATNFRRGTEPNAAGDLAAEARAFLDAGVDGIFADHPDVVVEVVDAR